MILSSWLTTVSNRIRNASARRRLSRKYKGNRYARPAGVLDSSSTTYARPSGDIRESLWHTFDVAPRFHRDSRRFQRQVWSTADFASKTERLEDRTLLSAVNLSVDTNTGTEAGTTVVTVTATADSAVTGAQTVDVAVTDMTTGDLTTGGIRATDFILSNGTITIPDTMTTGSVTFTVQDDALVEALTETATLTISNPSAGVTLGTTTTQNVAITDNDTATISINGPTATEGGTLAFSVTTDKAVDVAVTADRRTNDGTATTADSDYTAIANSNVQLFAANSTTPFGVNVSTTSDNKVELNETVQLILSNLAASGRSVQFNGAGATLTGTGTINNDDTATISISSPSVAEGGTLGFSVTIDKPVDVAVTADRATADGTATTANSDYTAISSGNLQLFAANSTTANTINVTTTADNTVELNETLSLILSNLAASGRSVQFNGAGATLTGTGTINNDDTATISISSPSVTEGGTLGFSVTIDKPVDVAVTADRATANGTATTGDSDYTALSSSNVQLFAANSTTANTINVTTTTDNKVELNETLSLILSSLAATGRSVQFNGAGATLTGTGTINNDDTAVLSIADVTKAENGTFTFTVTSSNPSDADITGTINTADITDEAEAGADYTAIINGTFTITGNGSDTTDTFTVTVSNDNIVEDDETFDVNLTNARYGGATDATRATFTGGDDSAVGTIENNDTAVLSIADISVAENGTFTFTVTSSNPTDADITGTIDTADVADEAEAGTDYTAIVGATFTITGDESDTTDTFTVTVSDDKRVEGDELFDVNLSAPKFGGATDATRATFTGGDDSATGTIDDDDTVEFTFSQATSNVDEDDVEHSVEVTATIIPNSGSVGNPGFDRTISVDVVRTGGSAKPTNPDADFTYSTTTFTFDSSDGDGATFTENATIDIHEDILDDDAETIVLTLQDIVDGSGTQASVGTPGTHTVTINDDDDATVVFEVPTGSGNVEVQINGANLEILVGGVVQSSAPVAGITALNLTGPGDGSTTTLNVASGTLPATINFDGGGADTLLVQGTNSTTVLTYDGVGAAQDGTVLIDGITINYDNVPNNTLNITGTNNLTLNFAGGDTGITFTAVDANTTQVAGNSFTTTTFANPATSFTVNLTGNNVYSALFTDLADNFNPTNGIDINGFGGADTITVTDLGDSFTGHFDAQLGGGTDSVVFQTNNQSFDQLTLASETITATSVALTVANATSLTAGTGTINLNNAGHDFQGNVTVVSGGTTTIRDTNALTLANSSTSGTTTLTAGTNLTLNNLNASGQTVSLTATAGSIIDGNGGTNNVTATSLTASAATGIDLDTTITTLTSATTTGTGAINISDSAGGLTATTVSSNDGSVTLNATGGNLTVGTSVTAGGNNNATLTTTTSGNVILTGTTTAAGDQVTITSAGAINGAGLVTASTIDLNAASGIGNTTQLELAGTTITADTTTGNVDIDNALATATTYTSISTNTGSITVDNSGGGTATFTSVTTSGDIDLENTGANLTATSVVAGGSGNIALTTTTSGNVLVGLADAAGDAVTITSAGAIEESGADAGVDIDGEDLNLTAATGIGAADTIEIDAFGTSTHGLTASVTGTGNIDVSDRTGTLRVLSATTNDGSITIDAAAGNMTVETATAGGSNNLTLTTTGGTRDITIQDLDATGDTVIITATGAIIDGGAGQEITATNAALRATTGIGNGNALETTVSNLAFSNTTSGNVQISNTGGLTIASVDGQATSSNVGTGTTTLTASSPVTFAVNTSSGGDLTANATESGAATDDITVNAGVTVQSTGGDVILNAGDDIIIAATAVVQATTASVGDVTLNAGVADADNVATMTLNGTVSANTTDGVVTLDLRPEFAPTVSQAATQGAAGTITAANLRLLSTGSDGSFDLSASSTNDVDTIAAATTGSINFRDDDGLTVGTVGGTTGITTSDDAVTIESSNGAGGTITVSQAITTAGAGTTGSVELNGNVVVNASLTAAGGTITLNGQNAATSDLVINAAVTSAATINWTVQRDIIINAVVQATAAGSDIILTADSDNLAADGLGAGGVRVTTAGQVNANDEVTITGSDLFATGAGAAPFDSVDIQQDGANAQVTAGGNIGIASKTNPATANVRIAGIVQSTGTGNVTITANNDLVITIDGDVTSAGGTLDLNGGRDILIDGAAQITTTGAGTIDADAVRAINIDGAATLIQTVNGNLTMLANAGGVAGNFHGLLIDRATVQSTDGDISLTGTGGNGVGGLNAGLYLDNGATVQSTGTGVGAGTITLSGTAPGGNGGATDGVLVRANSTVTSVDGNISATGSAATDVGVVVASGGTISSTGVGTNAATITIVGNTNSNANNHAGVVVIQTGSNISSVDGNIDITGAGTAAGGVFVHDQASINSTGTGANAATITIDGDGVNQDGVNVASNGQIASAGGAISIDGLATVADGVELEAGSTLPISATNGATVAITGVGGTGQVAIQIDSPISSGTGTVTIMANDGASATDDITFGAAGDITSTSGTITIDADNADDTADVFMADGAVINAGAGTVEIIADVNFTVGEVITSGLVNAAALAGSVIDADAGAGNDITAGSLAISGETGVGTDADAIETTVATMAGRSNSGDFNISNTGDLNLATVTLATLAAGLFGETEVIGVTIADDADGDPDSGNDNLTIVTAGSLTVSLGPDFEGDTGGVDNNDGGNITLTANGATSDLTISAPVSVVDGDGGAADGDGNIDLNAGRDLFINNDAVVSTDASGVITGDAVRAIDITSTNAAVQSVDGSITLNANQGVAQAFSFDGLVIDGGAEVTTANGAITLNGRGGTTSGNDGVHIGAAGSTGTVSVTGTTGTITITGTGNATGTAEGVVVENSGSSISSTGGAISITGTSTTGDDGVEITAADITATNAATITIMGTGGTGFTTGMGINIDGGGTTVVSSDTGNVQLTGVGGNDDGISVNSAIVSSNTGTITLNGTGGTGANSDGVIVIGNSAQITSGNNIGITGVATNGDGVEIASGVASPVDATGAATLTITGTGGGGGNVAVQIDSPIDSATGAVTIRAENGGTATDDITFGAAGDVTSTSGFVTIDADTTGGTGDVFMANGAVINAGSGQIDIDADVNVTLGSIQTTSTTEPSIEIDAINGAVIDGGNADTDIVIGAGGTLAIRARTGVGSTNAIDTDMTTTTIAVSNSTSGNIQIDNSTAASATSLLTVETVDGTVGVVNSGNGTVNLTNASAINVEDNITSGGSITVTLNDNAGFGDDLTVNGRNSANTADLLISTTNNGSITFNVGDDAVVNGDITVSGGASRVTFNMDPAAGDAEAASNANDGATLTIATDPASDVSVITTNSANNATAGTFINGGNQNDTFNFGPQPTTDFVVNGNPPVFGDADVPPGDTLNLDLVNVTRGNAILTIGDPQVGDDAAAGTFTFLNPETEQSVRYTSIETVSAVDSTNPMTDADYHLVVDLGIVGPRAAGASTLGYQDGTPDTVDIRLNGDGGGGSGDVEVRIDDGAGFVQVFAGQDDQILSLTVIGTSDDETVVLTETVNGLPSFSTLDEEPVGTSIALAAPAIDNTANNGGVSAGAHLGAAFETHIDREPVQDANGALDIEANHVTLHFEGGTGTNALQFDFLTDKNVSYFSDLVDVTNKDNSGNIGIVDDATNVINLAISFANLDPIDINGAGGDLRIDATDTPATYELTITSQGGGDNQITGDNGFETTNFSGFGNVEIYGGTGSEIIDLVSLDATDPDGGGAAERLATLRLDGDNTGNQGVGAVSIGTDSAADIIHVRSMGSAGNGVDLTLFGGAGDDQFLIFNQDTVGDSDNTVDNIFGQIIVSPTAGSGATGEDSQDEAGTDALIVVDRDDATGDAVTFTHTNAGDATSATIDGLFDNGTGVDLTVNVNIDELTVVTTDGADTLNLDFQGIQHDLDNIAIYAAGDQDNFVFAADSNTPTGATILLDGDELATDATVPANTGINNDTIDFSAFTTPRTVTLTGVGPTSVTLTANAAFTLDAGGGAAAVTDTLNALVNNTVQYPAAGTDILVISGTDTDGNAFSTNFSVNSATTIQNLLDAINAEYDGAVVTLNGAGQLVVTANATGPVALALTITDRVGNTGQTTFPTMNTTDDGLGGSNQTLQTATALTTGGGTNAGTSTLLNNLDSNNATGGANYNGGVGGADTINITGVDTDGSAVAATLTNVNAATTVGQLVTAIDGAFAGATATLTNGIITLRANAEGILPLELVITDALTSDGSTRWDNHVFVQTTLGTSTVVDGFTGSETSINGTFTNIDSLRGPDAAGDTLVAPDLNNHWDLFDTPLAADSARGNNLGGFQGTDHGNLVASRSTADARIGGATTVGRPTAAVLTVPIVATLPEQDLIFASFENLTGGSLSDHFDLRDAATVTGFVNGAGGNDSIDYRDFTTSVLVDLFTGTATNINVAGGGAGIGQAGGLVAGTGGGTDDNSIENAIGGSAGDFIAGDNDDNILGDGPGNDYLNGGGFRATEAAAGALPGTPGFIGAGTSGDDIFRIEPVGGSADIIQDIAGSDTVDFRFATAGIGDTTTSFDMDITSDGLGVGAPQTVNNDGGANTVDFRRITLPLTDDPDTAPTTTVIPQPETAPSFVENFIGSTFNDYIFIDPLSLSGNFPVGSPPVARSVDGNNPSIENLPGTTDDIPAGDTLDFDSKGRTVVDTGLSLTAVGVGTVAYRDIETLVPFENAPGRVLDNTSVGFTLEGDGQHPTPSIGWDLISNTAAFGGSQYEVQTPDASHVARWTFDGVTPGLYRVSATWVDEAVDATDDPLSAAAPFTILDGDRAVSRELIDLQTLPDDFTDVGATWEDIGGLVLITGHQLVVELDPSDSSTVVADAVRIERVSIESSALTAAVAAGATTLNVDDATAFPAPNFSLLLGTETVTVSAVDIANNQLTISATAGAHPAGELAMVVRPEVEFQNGDALLLDGNGVLDFGTTQVGSTVEKTIRVVNNGTGDLSITPGAIPAGFTSSLAAGATTVTPGESLTFGITMTAAALGDFSGDILFTTDDLDEDEFSFRIAGSVADSTIIDDEDAGFSIVSGDWIHNVGAGFAGDYSSAVESTSGFATWTFTGLTAGQYRVSATWPVNDLAGQPLDDADSATTQAKFQTFDGTTAGTQLASVLVNQRVAPNDLVADGSVFEDIASNVTLAGDTLTIQLTKDINTGTLLADAIRVERLPDEILTVTTDGGATTVVDDTGVVSFGAPLTAAPIQKTFTLTNNSTVAGTNITLTGPIVPPAGFSLVQSSVFGTDATPVILTPGDSTSFILQFDAGVGGEASGRVSIATDAASISPFDFIVTGSGSPQFIDDSDFGDGFTIPVGTIAPATTSFTQNNWFNFNQHPQGRASSYFLKQQGTGTEVARWTFDVEPGVYRVSGTWPGIAQTSSSAPFRIFDAAGGTLLQTVSANQLSRPNDFLNDDTFWNDLGIPVTVTTNSLVVELSDSFTNGVYVTADAIRVERITDPEITVTNGGANLVDGTSSVDFGVTTSGTPVIQTFIVQNFGARNMFVDAASLAASLASIPGFSLATSFTSTELAPGESSVFQIQLDAATAGRYSGTIEFEADDLDEQLFSINVSGDVLDAGGTVVDDGDAGFTVVSGQFRNVYAPAGSGFNGDLLHSTTPSAGAFANLFAGSPIDEATWTYTGLTAATPQIYRLSTTWQSIGSNTATNARFNIYAGDTATGTLLDTITINQRNAPDDFVVGGVAFEELMGPFVLPAGEDMLTVQLADEAAGYAANGFVVADAMRLDSLDMPEIAVSQGATPLVSGTTTIDYGTTTPGNSVTRTFSVTNNGDVALALNSINIPNGFSSNDFGLAAFPVSVAAGATATFDLTLDASVTGDFFGDVVIATNDPGQNEFRFSVSGTATNVRIVDNGDAGYVPSGFSDVGGDSGFQGDTDVPTTPGGATDTAAWTISGLTNGTYRVSATWDHRGNPGANNAPFTIHDGATAADAQLGAATIDQSVLPNDFSDDGAFWEDLGIPVTITNATVGMADGSITVQLTDQANGHVLADAIRVELVTTPEIGVTVTAGGANIEDGGRLDFGEVALGADAATVSTINVTVTNLGVGMLELGEVFLPTAGYTLTGYTPGTALAAGATATFDIVLGTATAGTFAGVISFGTNDSDESPFDIVVSGTVSNTLIIDDGDAGFTTVGADWFSTSPGFQTDVTLNPGLTAGTDAATWTFTGLQNGGRYRVSTVWNEASNGASNATYTVTAGAGPQVIVVNQGLAPENAANAVSGTVTDRDDTFVNLGDIYVLTGTTLTVSLSAVADGRVLADAVRVELIDAAEIKVSEGATNVADGGTFDFGTAETGTPTLITFTVENEGAQNLTLDAASLATSLGTLAGYSLDTTFGSTTLTPGQTTTFIVQLDAAAAGTFAGQFSFTTNDADETTFDINVTGEVVTPVAFAGATLIIDDGDRTFASTSFTGGQWPDYGNGGFQGDQRMSAMRAGESATWTATGTGTARVAATWNATAFGDHEASFNIYDGDVATGTLLMTVMANQSLDPGMGLAPDGVTPDGFNADGANWDELGTFAFASGTITIELIGGIGRHGIADAIRLSAPNTLDAENVGPALPSEPDLMDENLPAIFDAAINAWSASGQVSAEQVAGLKNVFPIITDLPGTQVGQAVGSVIYLDRDAAGHGWFVDQTPDDSSEFSTLSALTERTANGNSHAVGDIDLLTVVLHEMGHVLGRIDLDPVTNPHNLMADVLPTGARRVPESANTVTSTGPADLTVQLPETAAHVDVSLFEGYLVIQSNHAVLERIAVGSTTSLTINGTDGRDNFRVDLDQSAAVNFDSIVIHGYGDDDTVVLDGVPTAFDGALTIDGGTGNDQIEVRGNQATAMTLNGAEGDDTILGGLGAETINGGSGNDVLFGGSGNDRINAGAGNDLVMGNTGDDTLVGNDGDDSIMGGAGRDVLAGGTGNDQLAGQGGNDTLLGHDGDDTLNGGSGQDALSGGAGNDRLRGGTQNDLLAGGLGNDIIQGNLGDDTLAGDDGDDSLSGGMGSDKLDGGAGANYLFGQQAVDSLFGASALREELKQNPQNVAPPLAAGLDTLIASELDEGAVPAPSGGAADPQAPAAPASQVDIDTDFNLFNEWIDLV